MFLPIHRIKCIAQCDIAHSYNVQFNIQSCTAQGKSITQLKIQMLYNRKSEHEIAGVFQHHENFWENLGKVFLNYRNQIYSDPQWAKYNFNLKWQKGLMCVAVTDSFSLFLNSTVGNLH